MLIHQGAESIKKNAHSAARIKSVKTGAVGRIKMHTVGTRANPVVHIAFGQIKQVTYTRHELCAAAVAQRLSHKSHCFLIICALHLMHPPRRVALDERSHLVTCSQFGQTLTRSLVDIDFLFHIDLTVKPIVYCIKDYPQTSEKIASLRGC